MYAMSRELPSYFSSEQTLLLRRRFRPDELGKGLLPSNDSIIVNDRVYGKNSYPEVSLSLKANL